MVNVLWQQISIYNLCSKTKKNPPLPNSKKPTSNDYLKYSGLAFQMLAIIALGILVGTRLDRYFQNSKSLFTVVCAILSILLSLGLILKDLIRKK
ncbi:MAG: AtpZ/AtpI family protein [Candidatus Competibacteraceae bacterium]|nr:AtpZ/AtpI family protein [Candidatus Competibacteraceae bacterium]